MDDTCISFIFSQQSGSVSPANVYYFSGCKTAFYKFFPRCTVTDIALELCITGMNRFAVSLIDNIAYITTWESDIRIDLVLASILFEWSAKLLTYKWYQS